MATNDHTYDITKPGNSSTEEIEADIVPLQRCPHLYIKYTAAKGSSYPRTIHPPTAEPIVVDPHEPSLRFATHRTTQPSDQQNQKERHSIPRS